MVQHGQGKLACLPKGAMGIATDLGVNGAVQTPDLFVHPKIPAIQTVPCKVLDCPRTEISLPSDKNGAGQLGARKDEQFVVFAFMLIFSPPKARYA